MTQGSTTTPPPLLALADCPCDGTDAIGWCAWLGGQGEAKTIGEVEEYFASVCYEVDQRMGEPAACRWYLNWYDDTPRKEMRAQLLAEVGRVLRQRYGLDTESADEKPAPSQRLREKFMYCRDNRLFTDGIDEATQVICLEGGTVSQGAIYLPSNYASKPEAKDAADFLRSEWDFALHLFQSWPEMA